MARNRALVPSVEANRKVADAQISFQPATDAKPKRTWTLPYSYLTVVVLLLNYFLAQYDKFILSYFQRQVVQDLGLTSTQYGLISGYGTGIVSALSAVPIAFVADYSESRLWVLIAAALWWNLCCILQGFCRNFWQIFLARLAMSMGQSPVEALSISLISDYVPTRWLFLMESILYVGVYIGEAVSAQIATAFDKTNTPWNDALKAIGIVGMICAIFLRLIAREPVRKNLTATVDAFTTDDLATDEPIEVERFRATARSLLFDSIKYIVHMESFWMLTLAAGARQFSGNVFGYYMPSYLAALYPANPNLLSRYGTIVGVVGSVACLLGGLICALTPRNPTMALLITAIGGMASAAFVICMVFSKNLANGSQRDGVQILYGTMSAAYLTAELWLGAFASLLAALFPPRMKTFCLAIYTCIIILIYSSAPQIIGLILRNYDMSSEAYVRATRNILAILIPVGYWVAGIGFLLALAAVRSDLVLQRHMIESSLHSGRISTFRARAFSVGISILGSLTVALFVTSLVVN